jgi:hypothetical protein
LLARIARTSAVVALYLIAQAIAFYLVAMLWRSGLLVLP